MKNILIIIVFGLAICSCCSDKYKPNEGFKDLELSSILIYIPINSLDKFEFAVFIDDNNNSKQMKIINSSRDEVKILDGHEYNAETIEYSLLDPNDNTYSIGITGTAQYDLVNSSREFVNCAIFTSHNGGLVPFIRIDEEGDAFVTQRGDIILNNRNYTDVFSSTDLSDEVDSYSILHYNFEFGIVGFKDKDNKLWSFDSYQ